MRLSCLNSFFCGPASVVVVIVVVVVVAFVVVVIMNRIDEGE